MNWKIWDKTGRPRELTFHLKLALSNQLGLRSADINPLLFMDQRAESDGERVTLFRIYDPAKLADGAVSEITFAGLDDQPKAMCFEGQIDSHKIVGRMRDVRV
ncbi:MAG: hypothetical protein HQ548_06795 [Chloroflexi bacterium]|nr:hypothetical protein [Chloroflexota bacterium]